MTQAYPLKWPDGQPRTPSFRRQNSKFKTTFAVARDELLREIQRIGGRYPVISTNIALRKDGLPYANQRNPDDPGVAVYFERKGKQMCFACDRWRKIEDNMQAIRKTIDAIRGIERWGASEMMERAFSAFESLPAPAADDWRTVLGVPGSCNKAEAYTAYLRLRSYHHPDKGGNSAMFHKVQTAWEKAQEELR